MKIIIAALSCLLLAGCVSRTREAELDYAIDMHKLLCEKIDNLTKLFPVLHITSFDYNNLYKFSN